MQRTKKQVIQTQQVGNTGIIFKFHVSTQGTTTAPAMPRKNGVWLEKCLHRTETKPATSNKVCRTSITIDELLNPME